MINMFVSVITISATLIEIVTGYQQMKKNKKIPKKHILVGIICMAVFLAWNMDKFSQILEGNVNTINGNNNNVFMGNDNTINFKDKTYDYPLECLIEQGVFTTTVAVDNDHMLYSAMDDLGVSLSNRNDIAIKIDNVSLTLHTFKPCVLPVYDFKRKLGADVYFQWYYGEIQEYKGNYPLYYQGIGFDFPEQTYNRENSKYLKVDSNNIEYIRFKLNNKESGIYEFDVNIEYTLGEKYFTQTDTVKVYLPSSNKAEVVTLPYTDFLVDRMYDYKNDILPDIYVTALKEQGEEGAITNESLVYEVYRLEALIMAHFSSYNSIENVVDIKRYVELYYSAVYGYKFGSNYSISKNEIDKLLNCLSLSYENDVSWKIKDAGYYLIPSYPIKSLNPYAHIEYIDFQDGLYTFKGYAYNDEKGLRTFHGEALEKQGDIEKINIYYEN